MKSFYISTAIAYPNGAPHLGHALEIIQADVLARFHRLWGKEVYFQTGTDEHGVKNWETAKKGKKEITLFLKENSQKFQTLYDSLHISYSNFIKTSIHDNHSRGSQKLWEELTKAGDIYKKKYIGQYCVGCESFKTEKELVEGKCLDHPTRTIETIEEENYFFKLSKYSKEVIQKIESDELKIIPKTRKNEIISWLKEAEDVSFSRKKAKLPWGIPVPQDPEHVMYVWCDALSNYITGIGYGVDDKEFNSKWPADIQVIGKDILRFHAAFWPAMLISAKLPLPKQLFTHGFILSEGKKMGKSTGNVVDPTKEIKKLGADQFRYCLIDAMPFEGDGNYSKQTIIKSVNKDLIGNVGNYINRVTTFITKFCDSNIHDSASFTLYKDNQIEDIKKDIEDLKILTALQKILKISQEGNEIFQHKEPWKLIKENKDQCMLEVSLLARRVKDLAILISPFIPQTSLKILEQLNLDSKEWLRWDKIDVALPDEHIISQPEILFEKIDEKEFLDDAKGDKIFSLDIKVGEITKIDDHPDATKLFISQISLGNGETRQIISGLKDYYTKEMLLGQKVLVVCNLQEATIRGESSQGMVLAGETTKDGQLVVKIATANESDPGTQVICENHSTEKEEITFKQFLKVKMHVKDKHILLGESLLKTKSSGTDDISVDLDTGIIK